MIDKGLDRVLTGFFGMAGIIILGLAGTQTMPSGDKIGAVLFGLAGIMWASVRVLSWKSGKMQKLGK